MSGKIRTQVVPKQYILEAAVNSFAEDIVIALFGEQADNRDSSSASVN